MKKLKFATMVNVAPPMEVDSVRLVETTIKHRDGGVIVKVAMMDGETKVDERAIHMGTDNAAAHVDLDKLERDILKVIKNCGVLPAGDIEES